MTEEPLEPPLLSRKWLLVHKNNKGKNWQSTRIVVGVVVTTTMTGEEPLEEVLLLCRAPGIIGGEWHDHPQIMAAAAYLSHRWRRQANHTLVVGATTTTAGDKWGQEERQQLQEERRLKLLAPLAGMTNDSTADDEATLVVVGVGERTGYGSYESYVSRHY